MLEKDLKERVSYKDILHSIEKNFPQINSIKPSESEFIEEILSNFQKAKTI